MKKFIAGIMMAAVVFAATPAAVRAADDHAIVNQAERDAKKAKIEAEKAAKKAQKEAEKAAKQAKKEAEKARKEAERQAKKFKKQMGG